MNEEYEKWDRLNSPDNTPTVPDSIEGLRRAYPEWEICKISLGGPPVELIAERLRGERRIFSAMHYTEAEACRALAAALTAAGWPAKEE